MIYLKGKKYSISKYKMGRYTYYTIWNDIKVVPVKEFSTQYGDSLKQVKKEFVELENN